MEIPIRKTRIPKEATRELNMDGLFRNSLRTRRPLEVLVVMMVTLAIALSPLRGYAYASAVSLTTAEEEVLGEEFLRYLKQRYALIQDPSIVGYVRKIGQEIVHQHVSPPFEFQFYVVKDNIYNAFAIPAGHVFIYSGLLAAMESEEELAGILAHEIAHVFCRHISKRIDQSKKIGLMTLAGILTGVFLGGSPEVAGAITSSSIAAGKSLSLRYSREDERQADQVGLKYLTKAGYSGAGLLHMLQKIREKHWFGSDQIPSYTTTHPAIEERMAYLDTWIQAHPEWKKGHEPKDSVAFHKMRTKLIALYGDRTAARHNFQRRLKKSDGDALAYYGKGLLLMREGHHEEAVKLLHRALQLRPLDGDILRDLGMVYLKMGSSHKGYKSLLAALASNPADQEAQLLLGRSQIETGDLAGALKTLKGLLESNPQYLPVHYSLGEVYGKTGDQAQSHYHLGMYYMKKSGFKNARFHLKRALELSSGKAKRQEEIREALKRLEHAALEEGKD